MNKSQKLTKLIFLAMMVAIGVVISPILRVEGMCPMAHFINVTCAVMLGPWYAFICALAIGIIRMAFMGIPPLALTGAIFGAFFSGMLYRLSKGKLICAFLSCNDIILRKNRSYMVFLCSFIYRRNTYRRKYCIYFLKAASESKAFIKIPDSTWFKCI